MNGKNDSMAIPFANALCLPTFTISGLASTTSSREAHEKVWKERRRTRTARSQRASEKREKKERSLVRNRNKTSQKKMTLTIQMLSVSPSSFSLLLPFSMWNRDSILLREFRCRHHPVSARLRYETKCLPFLPPCPWRNQTMKGEKFAMVVEKHSAQVVTVSFCGGFTLPSLLFPPIDLAWRMCFYQDLHVSCGT